MLRSARVQLWLTQKITAYLTEELKTKVEVKGVEIEFFKKVVLEQVYVEDQKKDTLFYADRLKLDISHFSFSKKQIDLDDIIFLKSKVFLVKDQDEKKFNYQFIVDHFSAKDTVPSDSSASWKVNFNAVTIINSHFIYQDKNDTSHVKGINFSDMSLRNINAKITGLVLGDTVKTAVKYLSFIEKSGFILKDVSCSAMISSTRMQFDNLRINTPGSLIVTDEIAFIYNSFEDFSGFVEKVKFKSKFGKTKLDLNDIAYFAPELMGINRTINFQGEVRGTVSDLKIKNMDLFFGKYSRFQGDIILTGLPDIEQTFILLSIKEFKTGKSDLEQIPAYPFDKKQTLSIPNNIGTLGLIRYKGNFTGFYNDFVAYGNFSTSIGTIVSDVSLQQDTSTRVFAYQGKIKTMNFNLGGFLFMEDYLGKISLDASINGKGLDQNASGNLKGTISSIAFNNYTYKNITAEGDLAKKIFSGFVAISDTNIHLKFNGSVDFTGSAPVFDFASEVDRANLNALNFTKLNTTSKISFKTEVKASGANLDNLLGEIYIHDLNYRQNKEDYNLNSLKLIAGNSNGKRSLTLASDIADGEITGDYNFRTLNQAIETFLSRYAPSYFEKQTRKSNDSKEEFQFTITANNTDRLTALFLPQLSITPNTSVYGQFSSKANSIDLKINSNKIELYGTRFENLNIDVASTANSIGTKLICEKIVYSEKVWVNDFVMNSTTRNDSSVFSVSWEKNTIEKLSSNINGSLLFANNQARLKIMPSAIYVSDSLWTISGNNEVVIDSTKIEVRGLRFIHENQQVSIEGVVSKIIAEPLILSLSNFDLENVNFFTKNISSSFKGAVSGTASVADFYKNPVFSSNLNFEKLHLNNELIGDGSISSFWNKETDIIDFTGSFTRGIVPNIQFSGFYHPSKKEDNLNLELTMEAMRLQFFEEYIKDYCSDLKGQLSGKVSVKGSVNKPVISGKLNVQAKKMRINYLNTVYSFNSDINIENNSFGVENLKLVDQNSNSASVTGKLYHDNFKKFQFDFDIDVKKFNCLNTTESLNNLYYGKAFVTGIVNIFGPLESLIIDASVKTEKGTQISIPLSSAQEIGESDFITFVKKDTGSVTVSNSYKVKLDGMQLNFNLDITPDAEVLLIFDARSGDIMKGRGNGNIKMTINTLGNFNMYGDFVIVSGDYLFTLKNIINKKFDLEKGGSIRWSGDPYNADINIAAVYRLKTSLSPLFPDDFTGIYKKRYAVNCRLLLSDQLMKPAINFDIVLPTVDESTEQLARETYEQNINEQVFSLLLLNSFVPKGGLDEAGAGANTSSELLSNQLTNMLSKVSNKFDLGVKYRPGDELVSQQVEVGVSTQLLNDRVSIDGSVGVAGSNAETGTTNQNTNNIVGDVNVEYKISEDGKLRAKAFNKSNENTLISNNGLYTQGAGIAYKEEFNTFKELYQMYLSKLKRKNKE